MRTCSAGFGPGRWWDQGLCDRRSRRMRRRLPTRTRTGLAPRRAHARLPTRPALVGRGCRGHSSRGFRRHIHETSAKTVIPSKPDEAPGAQPGSTPIATASSACERGQKRAGGGHPLRADRHQLDRRYLPRRCLQLEQVTTDPRWHTRDLTRQRRWGFFPVWSRSRRARARPSVHGSDRRDCDGGQDAALRARDWRAECGP